MSRERVVGAPVAHVVGGKAEDPPGHGTDVIIAVFLQVPPVDDVQRALQHGTQPLLALPQGPLGLFSSADIDRHALNVRLPRPFIGQEDGGPEGMQHRSILAPQPGFLAGHDTVFLKQVNDLVAELGVRVKIEGAVVKKFLP